MPNNQRVCAGGHIVDDTEVLGINATGNGGIEVWCVDHAHAFDARLTDIGGTQLQM